MTDDSAAARRRQAERDVVEDLVAGQGTSDDPEALPPEDVEQLAAIRLNPDNTAVASEDEIDRLGYMTDVRIYEGDLEARPPDSDQPDEPEEENLERLEATELRAEETDDPAEAAEEGFTYVPPVDPPVVVGERGEPEIGAGFGISADDEPFDADHHGEPLFAEDERTERVIEALRSHAATSAFADRLDVETLGSRVIVSGTLDDLSDEDEVLSVISEVDGVTDVVDRIEIASLG
jgi:hypothetical protein